MIFNAFHRTIGTLTFMTRGRFDLVPLDFGQKRDGGSISITDDTYSACRVFLKAVHWFHTAFPCCRCNASIAAATMRSEEHTSELQSLMRISYAVFCLKKKTLTQ